MAAGSWTWNASQQPRKFTTYERDQGGADEAVHRRYDRLHSRFLQPDPADFSYDLTDPQSFNRYSYTQSDPVNFSDPSGLLPGAGQCGAGSSFEDCYGGGGGFWGGGFNLNDRTIAGYNTIAENFRTELRWSYYDKEQGLLESFTILIASLPARLWSPRLTDPTFLGMISRIKAETPQSPSPQPVTRPPLSYFKCFNSFKFSSNFTGSARTVAEVVEVGSQLSLLGDMAATSYKMSARKAYIGGTRNRYASGLNFLFRRAADAVGSSTLKGTLTGIGNKVTPALAVTGAFTGGYNVSVAVQCATGVLN